MTTPPYDQQEAWDLARAYVTTWGTNDVDAHMFMWPSVAKFVFDGAVAPATSQELIQLRVMVLMNMLAEGASAVLKELAEATGEPADAIWQRLSLPGRPE